MSGTLIAFLTCAPLTGAGTPTGATSVAAGPGIGGNDNPASGWTTSVSVYSRSECNALHISVNNR